MSPTMFNSLLEEVFRKRKLNDGITIDGKKLSNIRFADDIVLLATSAKKLEAMIVELQNLSSEVGLQLNPQKTKVMTNNSKIPITIGSRQLDYVTEYIYLGQLMSFHNRRQNEIQRRIGNAWKRFWSLSFILTDKTYNLKLRSGVMNSCILPVLLYGAQTWSLTERERDMLRKCQRKMERKMLNITLRHRLRNEDIRRQTHLKDAAETADKLKKKWAGHVMRLNANRWTHILTTWDPRIGKRNAGRQKTRWADELRARFGHLWSRTAKDRQQWKLITK